MNMDKETFDVIFKVLQNSSHSIIVFNGITYDNYYCSSRSFFFAHTPPQKTYERYELDKPDFIFEYMKDALRIERYDGHEYIPIWNKEDGLLKEGNLIKFRGKYITVSELERIITYMEDYVHQFESNG